MIIRVRPHAITRAMAVICPFIPRISLSSLRSSILITHHQESVFTGARFSFE